MLKACESLRELSYSLLFSPSPSSWAYLRFERQFLRQQAFGKSTHVSFWLAKGVFFSGLGSAFFGKPWALEKPRVWEVGTSLTDSLGQVFVRSGMPL